MSRVSVIIPAYNQGCFLVSAIESVLAQTYQDFEIVVVDDGSTDNTAEVAQSYSDPRVRYVYQDNRGLSAARNTGIRHSAGEFLSFLDSDDLFLPEKLELLTAVLDDRSDVGFVAGQAQPIDEQGKPTGKLFATPLPENGRELLNGNPLHVGSVLLRREWQERVGFFDESLRSYEDWDMWLRLARAGCRMSWVARPVSLYRFHRAQMTRDGSQMTVATFAVLDKLFNDPGLPTSWRDMHASAYSHAHLRAAAQAYRVRDFEAAKKNLALAVELNPELTANDAAVLAGHLSAWTELPKISEPITFLEDIYSNLPPELRVLHNKRRQAIGRLAMKVAFEAYQAGDLARARPAVRKAFGYELSWIANRGAIVVLLRSHVPFPSLRLYS
jgi:glycosyltransferase involved in cell wall biosynthesis